MLSIYEIRVAQELGEAAELEALRCRICIGSYAEDAWESVAGVDTLALMEIPFEQRPPVGRHPTLCRSVREVIGRFGQMDRTERTVLGLRLRLNGQEISDSYGVGGLWIVSDADNYPIGWLSRTMGHEAVFDLAGNMIERDARERVSRFWGNPQAEPPQPSILAEWRERVALPQTE